MQKDIFGNIIPETISIKKAANIASVSEATIRNWIKTNYLEKYRAKPKCRVWALPFLHIFSLGKINSSP